MALLMATDDWSVDIDDRLLHGVVFTDLTKAFATIDHEIILHEMSFMGVNHGQVAITWFLRHL